jgi:uncharacterized protein (DUF885 family)
MGRVLGNYLLFVKGQSRETVIEYLTQNLQMEPNFATTEVDRYLNYPGYDEGYYYGFLAIMELREKLKAEQADFSLNQFNTTMIKMGFPYVDFLEESYRAFQTQ